MRADICTIDLQKPSRCTLSAKTLRTWRRTALWRKAMRICRKVCILTEVRGIRIDEIVSEDIAVSDYV